MWLLHQISVFYIGIKSIMLKIFRYYNIYQMEVTKAANLFLWNFLGKMKQKVFETIILWFAFLSLQTCTILIVNAKKLLTFVLANLWFKWEQRKSLLLEYTIKKSRKSTKYFTFLFLVVQVLTYKPQLANSNCKVLLSLTVTLS